MPNHQSPTSSSDTAVQVSELCTYLRATPFEEFASWLLGRPFKVFDVDGNGSIDRTELADAVTTYLALPPDERVSADTGSWVIPAERKAAPVAAPVAAASELVRQGKPMQPPPPPNKRGFTPRAGTAANK